MLSWCDRLSEYRLHVLHPATLNKFLNDVLLVMLVESCFGPVAFEEVEYRGVISIAREAVVHNALLVLRKSGRLLVNSLDLIGMFRVGVDLPMLVIGPKIGGLQLMVRESLTSTELEDSPCHRHKTRPRGSSTCSLRS